MTDATGDAPAVAVDTEVESLGTRVWENIKGGNLGSWPVTIGLLGIVIAFSLTAQNFFTAVNFNNIVTQMAGVTMLAFGVVFVLLLGEIDLSIAYMSAIAGVVAAKMQIPDGSHELHGIWPILVAIAVATLIGAFQGSFVALIGVPAFVVTLAGLLAWQGAVQISLGAGGPIIIQNTYINDTASYFFSDRAGWIIATIVSVAYAAGIGGSVISRVRHGVPVRYPVLVALKLLAVPALAFLVIGISNHDRGFPLAGCSSCCSCCSGRTSRSGRRSAATCTRSAATPKRRAAPASTSRASASSCS